MCIFQLHCIHTNPNNKSLYCDVCGVSADCMSSCYLDRYLCVLHSSLCECVHVCICVCVCVCVCVCISISSVVVYRGCQFLSLPWRRVLAIPFCYPSIVALGFRPPTYHPYMYTLSNPHPSYTIRHLSCLSPLQMSH